MSSIPDTSDTVLTLTTSIFPDWSQGVEHQTTRGVSIFKSRSGTEQRTSRSTKEFKAMEYTVDGKTPEQIEGVFELLENRGRGPLWVPWFPEGFRIATDMPNADELQLEINPQRDWSYDGDTVLIGTELREIDDRTGRLLELVTAGSTTAQDAGTWVFPMRRAVLERPDDGITLINLNASRQRLRFVQIERQENA